MDLAKNDVTGEFRLTLKISQAGKQGFNKNGAAEIDESSMQTEKVFRNLPERRK